uniref:Uncharacterized protein n=1 Tax=Micrurus surinamensis TaxID=129470 RepID=A0A2D4PC25_MICSU
MGVLHIATPPLKRGGQFDSVLHSPQKIFGFLKSFPLQLGCQKRPLFQISSLSQNGVCLCHFLKGRFWVEGWARLVPCPPLKSSSPFLPPFLPSLLPSTSKDWPS